MERETARFLGILVVSLFVVELVAIMTIQGNQKVTIPGSPRATDSSVPSFDSYEQMSEFVMQSVTYQTVTMFSGMTTTAMMTSTVTAASSTSASGDVPYTSTNVQVQGVDEPDTVKTDGKYLYAVSGSSVFVVLAYPANESRLISRLPFNGTVIGIFLSGDRLAVVWTEGIHSSGYAPSQRTTISLYDVGVPSSPMLVKEVSLDADYVNSRLTGGRIYAVVQEYALQALADGNQTMAPVTIVEDGVKEVLPASSVYYNPSSRGTSGTYTIVLSIRLADGVSTAEAVLTGYAPTIYASQSNVYVAFPDASPVGRYIPSASTMARRTGPNIGWEGTNTTIFRVAIANDSVQVAAEGTIPGTVLNQFSMDEFGGHFRIATTSEGYQPFNNLYVLDPNLNIVGSLEGFAQDEKIYAVRFMGDRAYVVTFFRVDPLFAISLDDPLHPTILSQLSMPGFSDYLHPIGDGFLIGVGKNSTLRPEGSGMFTLYQGLKISLFRVESNGNSTEVSSIFIGDRGSDSPALSDQKAFLYDPATKILGLPILVAKLDSFAGRFGPWDYGTPVWQGAVFYSVSSSGFSLIGNVTHIPQGQAVDANQPLFVNRILLIGNYAYTISDEEIFVSAIPSMSTVSEISLSSA